MQVVVVAQTEFNWEAFGEASGYVPHYSVDRPEEMFEEAGDDTYKFTDEYDAFIRALPRDHDELAEAAGRLCYKSWNRPNPATATNDGYLGNILCHGHYSVLEHASATLYVSGVSRNLLVELERHRHLSFSVVSQRYVDHKYAGVMLPPAVAELDEVNKEALRSEIAHAHSVAQDTYSYVYNELRDLGLPVKKAREAARSALPGGTETEFLVTGNHRAFREFLQKRMRAEADAEMYQFARAVYAAVEPLAPATYQDISDPEGARP